MQYSLLLNFLNHLEEQQIYYRLDKIRENSILIDVTVPGQRWEIEFMDDGEIVVEKFLSDGRIYDEKELDLLFRDYS